MLLSALAASQGLSLLGDADRFDVDIVGVTTVGAAAGHELGFVGHHRDRAAASTTAAAALLCDADFAAEHAHEVPCPLLYSDDLPRALAGVLAALHPMARPPPGVHPRAVVHADAIVDATATIEAGAVLGRTKVGAHSVIAAGAILEDDVQVGPACVIGPGSILRRGTRLGADVHLGAGCVVGEAGFVTFADGQQNLPVVPGRGVILHDGVDVGAQVCIDRGLLRDTVVGPRTRIDNLVQIAHDVVIGADCLVVAQVGIAGYAELGDGVVVAGQAGINPYVQVAAGARVGGQAGVTSDIVDTGAYVSGTPARPHHEWLKGQAWLRRQVRGKAR